MHEKKKQKQKQKHNSEDEVDDDEEYSEDDDDDDDDESFSSLSELSTESDLGSESDTDTALKSKTKESSVKSKSSKSKLSKKEKIKNEKSRVKAEPKAAMTRDKEHEKAEVQATIEGGAESDVEAIDSVDDMTREMQKLAMANIAPARIPSSVLSPGEYMYNVITDVLDTNNKKNFQRILSRTPLPIALKYLHQIAQKAFATGNKEIHKVFLDTNKKYNIVSDVYVDAFAKGDSKSISNAMVYLGKTVQAFTNGAPFNIDELLKFFTPEFIAMNLIQAGNIEAYDKVMTEFKNEEIRISRGFHVAKPLLAAYFGVPNFFSNQKRYTFNRDIIVLAICGGSTETLDYVVKKTKIGKISRDIVLEARSCQSIPANMKKHLVDKYNVSEMSV